MTHSDPSDSDLKAVLRQWRVTPVDGATSDRLIGAAMARPQIRSWLQRLAHELELGLTNLTYGIGYKLAAAAACLMLGAGLGGDLEQPASNIAGIALMLEGMTAS